VTLLTDHWNAPFVDEEEIAKVVVVVFRDIPMARDEMYVHIKQFRRVPRKRKARFLEYLSGGNGCRIGIAVGVPPELEPLVELAVMGEEHGIGFGMNDPA
jgi:hypothetical protein